MLEHEYKYAATKEEFEKISEKIQRSSNIFAMKRGVQINYYYDTENMDFQSQGTTIRIRQKETGMKLQIKKKNYYGLHKNLETASEIFDIPKSIIIEDKNVRLDGQLVTDRTRYVFNNGVNVDLDINFYCGIVDYEVEIEIPEDLNDIEDILMLACELQPSKMGKATRFYLQSKIKGECSGI